MAGIVRDLRYAVTSLLHDRASVALAILALSLGIGATTVIFSVVYSVFVAAFPFRDQSEADVSSGRRMAVVNRTFVERFLNGGDALSRTVAFGRGDPKNPVLFEIVGVVGDVRNSGWEGPIRPQA